MLHLLFDNQLALGLAQAASVVVIVFLVVWLARWHSIHMEKEIFVALVRAIVQVLAIGMLLLFILQSTHLVGTVVLGVMIVTAAFIAKRRAATLSGVLRVALSSIGSGAGLVILTMTWLGVIDAELSSLVPVGSMIIANAMKGCALTLERFQAEVASHEKLIETGLALGAAPTSVVAPYVRASIEASLIPTVDSMRSLGIVWIPGLMAGMILSGVDPVYAALYQFVVLAMILAASALTAIVAGLLIRTRVFTSAEQLIEFSGR